MSARTNTRDAVARRRASRRHPRPTQFDYLHLRRLLDDLAPALAALAPPGSEVLEVFCGSRPYDDLYADGVRVVGLDIDDTYGVADIVTSEFLPGPDAAFDALACVEAFHYVRDPAAGVAEMARVLKPGGCALVAVPLVWEYDLTTYEGRFTAPALSELFRDWEDVRVIENGGRAVAWTLLTGTMLHAAEGRLAARVPRAVAAAAFKPVYVALNALGMLLDRIERPRRHPTRRFPANLLLTARRPAS